MNTILFVAAVFLGWRYPDSHPLPVVLFLLLAPIIMVAEGLH